MATASTQARMNAADRRSVIELEAGRLFGEHGYDATRIEDVAAAAGVTKPIVYRHFTSKKELYVALLRRHEEDLPKFTAGIEPGSVSTEALIGAILDGWLDYVAHNSFSWLIIFRDRTGDPEIEAARQSVNERAREVLSALVGQMGPTVAPDRVEPLAEFMSRGLAGLVLWWIDNPHAEKELVHEVATSACVSLLTR